MSHETVRRLSAGVWHVFSGWALVCGMCSLAFKPHYSISILATISYILDDFQRSTARVVRTGVARWQRVQRWRLQLRFLVRHSCQRWSHILNTTNGHTHITGTVRVISIQKRGETNVQSIYRNTSLEMCQLSQLEWREAALLFCRQCPLYSLIQTVLSTSFAPTFCSSTSFLPHKHQRNLFSALYYG